jgi:hypothetical protein
MSNARDPGLTQKAPRLQRSMLGHDGRGVGGALTVPLPSNMSNGFSGTGISGIGGGPATFPINVNGSRTGITASHDLRYTWARTVQVSEAAGSMGISEAVFSYSDVSRERDLARADKDLERGVAWRHSQLVDSGIGPAWPINQLDKKLSALSAEEIKIVQDDPGMWSQMIQFSGVQITQPVLQACGHVLFGRSPVIPRDMVTCTVQGKADVFNVWNREKTAIRRMDRLYVCIVRRTHKNHDTVTFGMRPAVGRSNGLAPSTAYRLGKDSDHVCEIVLSYFIGTVISQNKVRLVAKNKLEELFTNNQQNKQSHPQSFGLQLISILVRI